jgi:hypothetical protein
MGWPVIRAGLPQRPLDLGAYGPRGVQIGISPLRIPNCYSFSAGGRIQLVKNRADVELDSVLRDTETPRDIFVDEPLRSSMRTWETLSAPVQWVQTRR